MGSLFLFAKLRKKTSKERTAKKKRKKVISSTELEKWDDGYKGMEKSGCG